MEAGGKRYIVHKSRSDEFKVWNLSDLHLLSSSCAEKELRRDIKMIADDPQSYWFGGGDYVDYIGYDDGKRFDTDCVAASLSIRDLGVLGKHSVETVRDWLAPIKSKCLGLLLGNHEKQYQKRHQQEYLHAWLCTELGVANLGYSAFVDVVFVRESKAKKTGLVLDAAAIERNNCNASSFRFFLHHGAGYAQTPGGKLNRLIQFMNAFEADIYMVGHVHDKTGRAHPVLSADQYCAKLTQRLRVGVISGSYLKTYQQGVTSYGEQRGYAPTQIGASWISITPDTRAIRAEL